MYHQGRPRFSFKIKFRRVKHCYVQSPWLAAGNSGSQLYEGGRPDMSRCGHVTPDGRRKVFFAVLGPGLEPGESGEGGARQTSWVKAF